MQTEAFLWPAVLGAARGHGIRGAQRGQTDDTSHISGWQHAEVSRFCMTGTLHIIDAIIQHNDFLQVNGSVSKKVKFVRKQTAMLQPHCISKYQTNYGRRKGNHLSTCSSKHSHHQRHKSCLGVQILWHPAGGSELGCSRKYLEVTMRSLRLCWAWLCYNSQVEQLVLREQCGAATWRSKGNVVGHWSQTPTGDLETVEQGAEITDDSSYVKVSSIEKVKSTKTYLLKLFVFLWQLQF